MKGQINITKNMTQDDLVRSLMPIVKRTAARMSQGTTTRVSNEDLVSAGLLGLVEATLRFDKDRTESFVGYAKLRIRGAMLDELRRIDPLTQEERSMSRRIENAVRELQHELNRQPEASEIAARIGVDVETYQSDLEGLSSIRVVAVDPDDETFRSLTSAGRSPLESQTAKEMEKNIAEAVRYLPPKEAKVMALYYDEEMTFREIGDILDLTPARVCQLHGQAVHRIRASLGNVDSDAQRAFEKKEGELKTAKAQRKSA